MGPWQYYAMAAAFLQCCACWHPCRIVLVTFYLRRWQVPRLNEPFVQKVLAAGEEYAMHYCPVFKCKEHWSFC